MMPKDVFVMRAPEPEPEWEWSRWLRATEKSLGPTPLLLFVLDRFDAMEGMLRRSEWSGYQQGDLLSGRCCPECSWPASGAPRHDPACTLGALLAEIDAAKTSAASSPALVSRCVLDEHTCPTCFAADGSPATSTPACEHLAKGTGMCRCVLVPATKAGG